MKNKVKTSQRSIKNIDRGIDDILFNWIVAKESLLDREIRERIKKFLHSQGVVIQVDRELPVEKNNMGNISKEQCLEFFQAVKAELVLGIGFEFTSTTPSICLGDKILLCENDIQYPWFTKQMILHEIAHHLEPDDKFHGVRFHKKYAELVNRFLAGYVAVEPLIKGEVNEEQSKDKPKKH